MAPFGRNFLKARLKNRSKEAEESPGKEIQVCVCQEEKVVCGVTKHTTCADVVQALLDDHGTLPEGRRTLRGEPQEFCLLERWKGFERPLPPLTRILRLWNAWGDQKPSVHFALVKTSECAPPPPTTTGKAGKRSSRSRSAAATAGGGRARRWEQCPAQYAKTLPAERQKRLVKKAFRKLERIRLESESAGSSSSPSATPVKQRQQQEGGSGEVDGMVQLIITQDQTIRQQLQRMRELDLQIELAERLARLEGAGAASAVDEGAGVASSDSPRLSLTDSCEGQSLCEDYLPANGGVEQLEEQLRRHQELILELSRDIDAELRGGQGSPEDEEETLGATASPPPLDLELDSPELDSVRADLERSMRAGLSLYAQTQDLDRELQGHDGTLLSKSQECQLLAAQLGALQLGEGAPQPGPSPLKSQQAKSSLAQQQQQQQGLGEEKLRQGLTPDAADTDSDTGISSTHSQDSLSPTVNRRPPLDTDV
ncbi:ras association domain-containing protein 9 [Sardina pilchardus]|uniref:ras association domain-containing protein 9 n=1 Tax=Sardina pilchardus TaxID=27697 RepID=UPI002E1221F9